MGLLAAIEQYDTAAISIHPPREGWDPYFGIKHCFDLPFQSTHPVRGGTGFTVDKITSHKISIHPPREGWDCIRRQQEEYKKNFNPPTP